MVSSIKAQIRLTTTHREKLKHMFSDSPLGTSLCVYILINRPQYFKACSSSDWRVWATLLSSNRINLEYERMWGPHSFHRHPPQARSCKINEYWQVLRGLLFTEFRRRCCSLCLAHQTVIIAERGYTWTAFPRRFLPRATLFFLEFGMRFVYSCTSDGPGAFRHFG